MKIFVLGFLMMLSGLAVSQTMEFHSLKKLPAGVNSTGEESLPMLSPDGRQLFYTRALYAGNSGGKFSGLDVWYSESTGESWRNASNNIPGDINTDGHNALVGMSRDGNKRYFVRASSSEKTTGIYVSTRINTYWTRPEFVPIPGIDNQNFLGIFVSPDFDVIFISMKADDSRGEEDLYFSVKNASGAWSAPRNMGATINTKGFEISPFLSDDKKRLYFASNGHGGEGDADIFYSERLYNSWETWSLPVNLGKTVNSKKFDAYFSIYGDSVAYLSSNRDGKYADLYQVRVAPVRTVLEPGQRYLTREEWNRELGGAVANEIYFAGGSASLNSSQKELLFYIANKLQLQKTILFHLVAEEQERAELTEARLEAISAHLVQSGIDRERILIEQVDSPQNTGKGKVRILLVE